MYDKIDIDYGIQDIFTTIPYKNGRAFEKDIEQDFFEAYKNGSGNKDNNLYKPLKFYVLGDYDVLYISLINNFKFSHKLFEPKDNDENFAFNSHTFQSYGGFSLTSQEVVDDIFSNTISEYFVGVINLKLNNGLLLGNGIAFIEKVYHHLNKKLESLGLKFIISQTFSWFELSIKIFTDYPDQLTEVLVLLRTLEYKKFDIDAELENSLYHSIFTDQKDKIETTSIFSDTHTYFGFNARLISNELEDKYVSSFIEHVKNKEIKLQTQIEWHVKPGHILQLVQLLNSNDKLSKILKFDDRKLILGKSDYLLQETDHNILSNFYLILEIHKNSNSKIFEHARKVRSYVFLEVDESILPECGNDDPLSLEPCFDNLSISSSEFFSVNDSLKKLKISRQIRNKILKIFSNYNNGIQDPILFPYFLDFTIFIKKNVFPLIDEELSKGKGDKSIATFQRQLNWHIKVFQEGYDDRFLNSYQFENISDFDLDFNSSIQQLLTGYNSVVSQYVKLFYGEDTNNSPIVQLNDINTVSNHLSINYSVHHLTSPEFVFTTILKEILNNLRIDDEDYIKLLNGFERNRVKILSKINESYLDDMFERKQVDINRLIIDCIRFIITFNCNFQLFTHWFWSYNFQNSSLYNTDGMFNEEFLKMEMLRLKMVEHFFDIDEVDFEWPVPELYTYWNRHRKKINKISKKLIDNIKTDEFKKLLNGIVNNYLESYSVVRDGNDIYLAVEEYKKYLKFSEKIDFLNRDLYNKRLTYLFSKSAKTDYDIHEFERSMFKTLLEYFEECNSKIVLLKRDWVTGEPLSQYKFQYKKSLYAIDQMGGVFFYDSAKSDKYFKMSSECLLRVIDFSLKEKKNFILRYFNG